MPEPDPFDFSALADNLDEDVELDDIPAFSAGLEATIAHRSLASVDDLAGDDFEAELERMMAEEIGLGMTDQDVDDQLRQLQEALARLNESLLDVQLDAEEALLESLLLDASEGPE